MRSLQQADLAVSQRVSAGVRDVGQRIWPGVYDRVWIHIERGVWDSVWDNVRGSAWRAIWHTARDNVRDSIEAILEE